jgi:hypothetical protein
MPDAEKQYEALQRRIIEENEKSAERMSKKADYKIQIWFKSERSMHKPVAFSLSFWESGKRLHGGGDEMMFICRRHAEAPKATPFEVAAAHKATERGCDLLIPGGLAQGIIVCPHCGLRHKPNEIGDSIFYRVSVDQAANILETWWSRLECNADLYAKYAPTDPRTALMYQNYNHRVAREKKGLTIYPLENILKDTIAGSSIHSRFKAFITA